MFPMHDHPFSFQMHYIRTRRITGGNSGEFNQCWLWNPTQSNFCCASIHQAPWSSGMQAWMVCVSVSARVCVCVCVERAVACSKSQQTLPRSAGGWTEWRAKWDWEMQPPTWQQSSSDDTFLPVFSSLLLALQFNASGNQNDFTPLLFAGIRVFVHQIFDLDGCHWRRWKGQGEGEADASGRISAIWKQPARSVRSSANTNYMSNHRCDTSLRGKDDAAETKCRFPLGWKHWTHQFGLINADDILFAGWSFFFFFFTLSSPGNCAQGRCSRTNPNS